MSLENVKVGDWIKLQVTEISDDSEGYPIKCGKDLSFKTSGQYYEMDESPTAFPVNEFQERWMMVSNQGVEWFRRKVITKKNSKFIAWNAAETDDEVEKAVDTATWNLAKEIEDIPEYTMEELTKMLGREFKIKK
jgi:hypothetical protein